MTPYGKIAQYAIAAVSRLAEVYHADETTKLNSADIAQRRNLPRPMVAKVLTVLSQAGIVRGTPGPGGGYWLAREPGAVTLYDVVSLFERLDEAVSCPLGPPLLRHRTAVPDACRYSEDARPDRRVSKDEPLRQFHDSPK